ncbi:MAG TPA: IS1595 family transposase [Burkholderiales bacterium]|nr:IS1595 family transposase [Burkholderiales bacterium]
MQKAAKNHLQIHQMTIAQFEQLFPDEDHCKAYLTRNRWPDGVIRCPRCGNDKVWELPSRAHHWQCKQCAEQGYRFSVLVGTIFENTNKPLRDWFRVMHMMLTSKKGISALQIYRVMGFGSYNTAHLMCSKIRVALGNVEFKQLVGYVEVDETYVGGKAKNKHKDKRGGPPGASGQGTYGKTSVVGAISRKGNVVARVMDGTDAKTLNAFVREVVSHKVSLISTDEHGGYKYLSRDFPHGMVRHTSGEYVHGNIHTNTIEGFWSLVKRGIMGTFHKVSRKYLPLYVNEFQFRYNNRTNPDIFGTAIRAC